MLSKKRIVKCACSLSLNEVGMNIIDEYFIRKIVGKIETETFSRLVLRVTVLLNHVKHTCSIVYYFLLKKQITS